MKQLLQRLGLFVRRWQTYSRIRAELDGYGDRELRDIGILRADVAQVAREAAGLTKPSGRFGQEAHFGARASHV